MGFSPWVLKESNVTERLTLSLFHLPGWLRAQFVCVFFVFLIIKKLGLKSLTYHVSFVTFYSCFTLCFDFLICKTELLICISEDFCED